MMDIDLLIINGNILTLDDNNHKARSLAVADGEIVGIWDSPEPPKDKVSITKETNTMDLQGATLIPGFIDTHNHILVYSLNKDKVDCSSPLNTCIADILTRIQSKVETTPAGEWIEGFSYDDTMLEEQRHPTKQELDTVAPDHPVYLKHITNHFAVANSKALEAAGVHEATADPSGGFLGRDDANQLNGVLHEFSAMNFVQSTIPLPTTEEMVEALGKGAKDYLAEGITTNADAGVGLFYDGKKEFDAHLLAAKNGTNPMRSQLMIMHHCLKDGDIFSDYTAEQLHEEIQQRSDGKARLDSAKMFQDGSIQGYTGALREPYYDDPQKMGELIHRQDDFNDEILDLHERGFRLAIHGNGDRAIGSIIEAYTNALQTKPKNNHRHRIEHVQTATSSDLDQMKEHGIIGSVFINHVYYWGDRHKRLFLGPERAANIDPLSDMVERNILTTLHSDCPVTPISPLFSVWAAVNRLTRDGDILGPHQQIDVTTALKMMTIYGAEMNFTAEENGSIEMGKQADFAILQEDPTEVNPLTIKDINVLGTMIDGKVVYEKESSID